MRRIRPYKTPAFPDVPFMLVEGGAETGPYEANQFGVYDKNVHVLANGYSSPLFLRVIKQVGRVIRTVDGTGAVFEYEMRPLSESQAGTVVLESA
jgi:hypothetical protein